MSSKLLVKISVDAEYQAPAWWHAVRSAKCPESLRPIIEGLSSEVVVPVSQAKLLEVWCAAFPGWDTGSADARTALVFHMLSGTDCT